MNVASYTFETLKLGYELKNDHYHCIFCQSTFHVDEVFPSEGRFFIVSPLFSLRNIILYPSTKNVSNTFPQSDIKIAFNLPLK